jgi:hypothetical protein
VGTSIERHDSFVERHAWKVFLAISGIVALFGVGDMLAGGSTYAEGESILLQRLGGMSWTQLRAASPNAGDVIDAQVRTGGMDLLLISLLSLSICVTALRRGERWAWYAMWVWPLWIVLIYALALVTFRYPGGIPVPLISGAVFFTVSVLTLALSYRKYVRR